ncbi:hypothetical protein F4778DRAFT_761220 [Xylariomycetidae sp. FL2044]|nr:hypothetical protein F4778DRAFT_761220 [Xylariomycetidae sp. FL2044]
MLSVGLGTSRHPFGLPLGVLATGSWHLSLAFPPSLPTYLPAGYQVPNLPRPTPSLPSFVTSANLECACACCVFPSVCISCPLSLVSLSVSLSLSTPVFPVSSRLCCCGPFRKHDQHQDLTSTYLMAAYSNKT